MRTVSIVNHRVADFDAWKAVYDGFGDVQREHGVRHHHVWRSQDDPAMADAGVDPSSVQIQFFDEAAGGAR